MLRKIPERLRRHDLDLRLLVPILVNSALVQAVVSVARVTTSYRAVELELSIVWLGVISATFALLPIVAAVWVGRFIDRGHDALAHWIGVALLAAACGGFTLWSSLTALIVFTVLLGAAHLFLMASMQMLCVRCGGTRRMEQVFGNYMVAGAIGQGLGPYIVGLVGGSATLPPTRLLFTISLVGAALALVVGLTVRPRKASSGSVEGGKVVPLRALLGVPGLNAVIVAGVFLVTAQDLIVIYLPILGAERGIDVKDVGLLLSVRAVASVVARLFYVRAVMTVGRDRLMVAGTLTAALAFAALAMPLPLLLMYASTAVLGFALGIATTLSVTTVIDRTPAGARGTANSLRIMGNRIGQVGLPFGVSLVAAATGAAGILAIIALSLAASALAVHLSRPRT